MELFLIISFMLESFSIISQSLTISNRLSINILAGSLLILLLLHCNYLSLLGAIEGLGTKRIFGIYLGINQRPNKYILIHQQYI